MTLRRQRLLASVVCVVGILCGACRNQETFTGPHSAVDPIPLRPEQIVAGTISDKAITYHFELAQAQPFILAFEKEATGIGLSVLAPDGHLLRSVSCSHDGPTQVAQLTPVSGTYSAKLESCRQGETSYQLTLSVPQSPTDLDNVRVEAERLSAQAELLASEYRANERRVAILKFKESMDLWKTAGDPIAQANVLLQIARLHRDLGEASQALNTAQQALVTGRESHDGVIQAEALVTLASIQLLEKGDTSRALMYCNQGLEIARASSDRRTEAAALYQLGLVHYETSTYDSATAALEESRRISQERRDNLGAARATLYLAAIDFDVLRFDTARDKGRQALEVFNSFHDKQGQATALTFIGHFESALGRNQEAMSSYAEARKLAADSGDFFVESSLMNGIAKVHFDLGNTEGALQFLNLALEKSRASDDSIGIAYALRAIGDCYFAADDSPKALDFYNQALHIFGLVKNRKMQAYVSQDIGMVLESTGKASSAMEYLNRSLNMGESIGDRRLQAGALTGIGRAHETAGRTEKALQSYEKALLKYDAVGDRLGKVTAFYYVATALRNTGRLQEALAHSERALDVIEKLRASVASSSLRASYFASVRQQYDLHVDVLMRLHKASGSNEFAVRAFEASERSRARTLLESIKETRLSISKGGDPGLIEREAIVGSLLDSKIERYTELLSTGTDQEIVSELSAEIRRLTAESDDLRAELRVRNPRHASLVQPDPLKLENIQKILLDDESLLLEYALGDEHSYLWAVSRNGFSSYVLPKRSEIETKVRQVREYMSPRLLKPGESTADALLRFRKEETQYAVAAAELSRMLLGPVARQLGTRRLVIVGESTLHYLPFGALPSPSSIQGSSPTLLISEREIVNLPSASMLAEVRKEAPLRGTADRMLAVFADPVFHVTDKRVKGRSVKTDSVTQAFQGTDPFGSSLPRLLATEQEAKAISAMVAQKARFVALGFEATRAAAMSADLSRYKIVHFATHTALNEAHPDLSSLVMSLVDEAGNPQNGHLRLRDIYNLRLSAELVVLSACETALGKEVKGEGMMSMVRGFMYAGTPRVLASLWKVDDEATAELMTEFYKELLQNNRPPAAALRQAQITQMRKPSRQSPFYWAGFQFQGEWRP